MAKTKGQKNMLSIPGMWVCPRCWGHWWMDSRPVCPEDGTPQPISPEA